MKNLLIAISFIALAGAGCSYPAPAVPPSEAPASTAAFNTSATFSIGESIAFQDGTAIKLTAINDSRCKPDVQCIWAGELSPAFIFYNVDKTSEEFTLGTMRTEQVTISNHVITLKSATTEQATITVSKK